MTYQILIPQYRPPSLNKLLTSHWAVSAKLKKQCVQMIMAYSHLIPPAKGKRRVDIHFTLTGRQKEYDDDNARKVLADALVQNKLLLDDSRQFVEWGAITYDRGDAKTLIILTDLPTV